jgi:hypothetical protein
MKLYSQQVASKLGISISGVNYLVKKGKLQDISGKNGKSHRHEFDSKQINEFAKTYKKYSKRYHFPPTASLEVVERTSPVKGIMSRLDSIEAKIEKLIQIWS